MNLSETFDAIETPEFSARLGIASSLETFLRIARSRSEAIQLVASLAEPCALTELALRIDQVLAREFDHEYQNPWDTAVALYLWALSTKDTLRARNYAKGIGDQSSDSWWWTRMMIERLLSQRRASGTVIVNPIPEVTTGASGAESQQPSKG